MAEYSNFAPISEPEPEPVPEPDFQTEIQPDEDEEPRSPPEEEPKEECDCKKGSWLERNWVMILAVIMLALALYFGYMNKD